MDNLLLGRPGPNLLPPEPLSPPANPLATPAAPPRIKGTALEQELLAQVDRLLLGRPGPNTDFLALAAQAPLWTPAETPDPMRRTIPAADPGPVWDVASEALPVPAPASPGRPVVAPRTQLQQPAAEPARKPTFEVTIGRLEVVAPPPEAPQQQQPRRPAPKTSLQDYLDRRRVGR